MTCLDSKLERKASLEAYFERPEEVGTDRDYYLATLSPHNAYKHNHKKPPKPKTRTLKDAFKVIKKKDIK